MGGEGEDSTWINADGKFAKQMRAAGVTSQHRIAIAVSGGADSMALCLLARRWKRRSSSLELGAVGKCEGLVGFVVDHGLRSGSAEEALCVQKWVSNLGFTCNILKCTWVHGVPALGHLQESARNARYALLAQACQRVGVEILLTAHHADDQAELFILRLSRCSGIAGLAGIASATSFHPQTMKGFVTCQLLLIRPLLKFVKEELYQVCQKSGQAWVEDPTNLNLNFARNRIRKALKETSLMAVQTEIKELIAFCRKIRSILDRNRDDLLTEVSQVSQEWGHITVEVEELLSSGVSKAVRHRAVAALMQFASQKVKPPRGRAVSSVIQHLRAKNPKGAFTVGGCNVFPAPGSKGSKAIFCFSPDSPLPSGPTPVSLDQSAQSVASELSSPLPGVPFLSHARPDNPIPDEFINDSISKAISLLTLDIKTPRTVVDEFKGLGLISDEAARWLNDLALVVSLDMHKSPVNHLGDALTPDMNSTLSQCSTAPLTFGRSEYFMDRFVVSASSGEREFVRQGAHPCVSKSNTDPSSGDCCLLRHKMWIRHFEEKDWVYLSRLARRMPDTQNVRGVKADVMSAGPQNLYCSKLDGTSQSKHRAQAVNGHLLDFTACSKVYSAHGASSPSCGVNSSPDELHDIDSCRGPWYEIERFSKAKEALAKLRSVPKLVRRGLPVIVTTQGLLLGMPSVGYRHCPLASMKAVFRPRIPLGGPRASWL
ncbi:unnamed protein product [Calypogeia fissa]